MKKTLLLIGLCLSLFAVNAQTYTFECVSGSRLTGDSCDICPNTIVESRSFNGLVIFRDSTFYRWVDQPYSIRVKPGNIIEYWEHSVNPYSERITIPLSLTGFFSVEGMADSTWCNSSAPNRFQNLTLDSINATQAAFSLTGDPTDEYLEEGTGITFSYQGDTLTINSSGGGATNLTFTGGASPYTLNSSTGTDVTLSEGAGITLTRLVNDLAIAAVDASTTNEVQTYGHAGTTNYTNTLSLGGGSFTLNAAGILAISHTTGTVTLTATEAQTANNGLSDNEAGGIFRWGNRYMNGSDGLFGTDRKQNVNAFMAFHGDNTDSLLFIVDGTNDRIGVGRLPQNRLDIAGSSGTYARVGTSGAVANAGFILNNSADLADTWAVYRQGDGDFAIGADADNEWPNGTLTDPFIIKPSPPDNSFYMDATGKVQLGGSSPQRTLHVTGEARVTDLVTDNPTLLVGADADGDLSGVTLGTNLSFTGTTLNATGGSFYQTWKDDGVAVAQQPNANFVATGRISTLLTNDAGNSETEVSLDIVANSIDNTHIRQGVARSVIGVTGNATANVADIQGTADQVLRVTTAGTALAFGTVATGGIANDAVTYAKIQNAAANNVVLGNNNGAATDYEELNAASLWTLLGITGVANRFALFTTATAIGTDAAFTFDAANDRATFTGTVSGVGANTGILNLNSGAIAASTTFLRASGNITNNMIAEVINANNAAATANTLLTLSTGGANAGDPILQLNIAGVVTHAFGIDNSDLDKIKITPNSATPGGVANASFVGTKDAVPLWGFNIDAPARTVDVAGGARAVNLINTTAPPTWSLEDTGLGVGGVVNSTTGGNNGFQVSFTTGTAPTADGVLFRLTFANGFTVTSTPSIFCKSVTALNECNKFSINGNSPGFITLKANGTLTASTNYILNIVTIGQ